MKYVIILGDGMADEPIEVLGAKTPLQVANKPTIDDFAKKGEVGICKTIPDGMKPGSDTANLSVLGYDPKIYYTGRSPLEAASIGIDLSDTSVTLRANLVTLSSEEDYKDKTIIDYSSGEITTAEAKQLIEYLAKHLNGENYSLYSGVSYRHCLVVENGKTGANLTPPHDITGKKILSYLPKGVNADFYLSLMQKSYDLLKDHPVNLERIKKGKKPANSLWFWGEGTKPNLDSFLGKFGINGAMISAVDLLKGIAKLTGMKNLEVDGATGNYETNFLGKAKACVDALNSGYDLVYLHMEAPDECGHQGDLEHKIYSIEQIDMVTKYIADNIDGEFSLLIMPDHPTPIAIKTHSSTPVPYLIYRSNSEVNGVNSYDEETAKTTNIFIENGHELILKFLDK